jgi:hypothetical protein
MLGIFMLVFLFLPLALRNNYLGEGNRKNTALYVITWVTCLVVFVAMLFKVMHWPGAGIALIIALPFPYLVFLPAYIVTTQETGIQISIILCTSSFFLPDFLSFPSCWR